jgi:serine phosphatase RsbU (regulator of sigma subunit)/anti-sigma regulatory factor (Ser/Thr protein kinase)
LARSDSAGGSERGPARLPSLFRQGGDGATRLAAVDWAAGPLGPPEGWSAALCEAVAITLESPIPTVVVWGAELVLFPNAAASALFGRLLSDGAGCPGSEVLRSIAMDLGAAVDAVRAGAGGQTVAAVPLVVEQHAQLLEPTATFCCVPIGPRSSDGSRPGVQVVIVGALVGDALASSNGGCADGATAALRGEAARVRKLAELGMALDAAGSVDEALAIVATTARDLLDAAVATAHLTNDGRWAVESVTETAVAIGSPHAPLVPDAGEVWHGRATARDDVVHLRGPALARVVTPADGAIREWMGVPLVSRDGERIGFVQVADKTTGAFDDIDRVLLAQLGRLAAMRVESFQQYQRAEAIAAFLQRRLLPEALPETDGIRASAAYIPGSNEADVGGDWYELVPLAGGRRVVVAIGDMVGRGIAAAAAMSELRNALRLLAAEQTEPAAALERLNEFVHTVGSGHFATCWYCVVDRDAMTVTYASAGHVPPVLVGATGMTRLLDAVSGPPVGARRGSRYSSTAVDIASGSTLLLYTDGLVEHDLHGETDPIDRLVEEVHTNAPDALVERLTALLPADGRRRDDTAVLAVQIDAAAARFEQRVALELTALGGLRRHLRAWLVDHGVGRDDITEVVLGVCEIVTNAIEHAAAPTEPFVAIEAELVGSDLRVVVADTGRWRTRRDRPERGRGIAIVRRLFDVDMERAASGTTVRLRRPVAVVHPTEPPDTDAASHRMARA